MSAKIEPTFLDRPNTFGSFLVRNLVRQHAEAVATERCLALHAHATSPIPLGVRASLARARLSSTVTR